MVCSCFRCVPKGAAPLYKEPIKALPPGDSALPTGSEANHMIQILLRAWKYSGSTLNALEFKCTVCKDQACTGLNVCENKNKYMDIKSQIINTYKIKILYVYLCIIYIIYLLHLIVMFPSN